MAERKKSKKKPKKEVKKAKESKVGKKPEEIKTEETKTEEVCNVFEVEKDGREKIVESCADVEEKPAGEKQIKEQNKILRNILIGVGIFVLFFIVGFYFTASVKNFEYNNMKFDIVKEKKITFYHTSFPMTYESGEKAIYNLFLRKDPRKLNEIPFEGDFVPSEMIVVNSSENFNCDGDGVIAIANFNNIFNALGTQVVNDPNASCDKYGRYIYINLQKGDKTEIKNIGKNCYNLNINNCEVLDATERFLLEALKYRNDNS